MTNEKTIVSRLVFHGCCIMFFAFVTGGFIAAAVMGQIDGNKEDWVLAHMECLVNSLAMFAVAGFIGKLTISNTQATVVSWCLVVMGYANTVFGFGRGFTGALGYEFEGNLANDVTAFAGTLGVPMAAIAFGTLMYAAWKTHDADS